MAKLLRKIAEKESPDLVIVGKQAIDDDSGQTGQILAGLLNWPQTTFASKLAVAQDKKSMEAVREIDGGSETVSVPLPAVVTTDLRLNEPRYATLPNIMKAKKKPVQKFTLQELGVDITRRHQILKVVEPPSRTGGAKVGSVDELLQKLKTEAKVI